MVTWLMYIHMLDPLYKSYYFKNSCWHVAQLETLYLYYGVKCQSGVIWGHWDQEVIFTKNAITRPCYIAQQWHSYMLINLRPSTYIMGQMSIWGHLGSLGSKGHFQLKNAITCHVTLNDHRRLIHVDQLETFYLCLGSNVNLGSFRVIGATVSRSVYRSSLLTLPLAAAGSCICPVSFFLLLSQSQLITPTCLNRFWPLLCSQNLQCIQMYSEWKYK